jgi:hypothetical protein
MSICFDDNSLIVNSDDFLCCTFMNLNSNTFIKISDCPIGYNGYNNSVFISSNLILNNNYNSHLNNMNIHDLNGWCSIYTSNLNTNIIGIDKLYLEAFLDENVTLQDYQVPFITDSPYWDNNNYYFIAPKKGLYSINYTWCCGINTTLNVFCFIMKNNEEYMLSNKANGSKEFFIELEMNDNIYFYYNPVNEDLDNNLISINRNINSVTKVTITLIYAIH